LRWKDSKLWLIAKEPRSEIFFSAQSSGAHIVSGSYPAHVCISTVVQAGFSRFKTAETRLNYGHVLKQFLPKNRLVAGFLCKKEELKWFG
jgi:hypothetical protein